MTTETATIDMTPASETIHDTDELPVVELDQRLEQAVREHERSERLICEYLVAMRNRRGYEKFGFADIYYYAEARFGFSSRKTRYLLELGTKLQTLPHIRQALAEGRLGWTKASKIARVATTEDETMWLESALALSVRDLDRKIRQDIDVIGVKVRAWLTQDQAAVWENALEICRRLAAEDLDVGRCLELIAGEFLATYAYLGYHKKEDEEPSETTTPSCTGDHHAEPSNTTDTELPFEEEDFSAVEERICPCEDGVLPRAGVAPYGKTWRGVLERDEYRCQYPDCGARAQLHVHHIVFRSRSGKKGRARSNDPSNLVTLCVFHHRMIHAGTIGVKGRAPSELEWRRPQLMESLLRRQGQPGQEPTLEYQDAVDEIHSGCGQVRELVVAYSA